MKLKNQISSTFRDIESDLGTTGLAVLVLESLLESLDTFKAKSTSDFIEQFRKLILIIKNTKPRMGIVIFYICEIWDELDEKRDKLKSMYNVKRILAKRIYELKKEIKRDSCKVVANGCRSVVDGDCILIHSHSSTVLQIIEKAKNNKVKFSVVVAEQENLKTLDIIKFLKAKAIDFCVVPEFMLSHIESQITKVFLGGVTFNDKFYFVTDAGTNAVVAEFHGVKIPIYMFITTKKYALWVSSEEHSRNKVSQTKEHKGVKELLTYNRIKFSHDRIHVDSIDKIVTEEGEYSPLQIKTDFKKKFKAKEKWQARHFENESCQVPE